jgi:hypothetical protein
MAKFTHPSVSIACGVLGEDWEPFDLLVRQDEAAVIELRHGELRDTQIILARDGEWIEPGLVSRNLRRMLTRRPGVTSLDQPVLHPQMTGSAWPTEDGSLPSQVWCSFDGAVAADVVAVIVATDLDRYEAHVREDGTFLAMVRATRREEPRVLFRLRTGEQIAVAL